MKAYFLLLLWLGLLPAFSTIRAQESTGGGPLLFEAEEVISLSLSGDLKRIYGDKSEDAPDRPAILTLRDDAGQETVFNLGVRTRGHFRLHYLDCDVPPLRLNFKKKSTVETPFAGQDKLKLVTHCRNRDLAFEQFIMQEYMIYKAYNLLTDYSFKVRLVRISYLDKKEKLKPITRYAFLIESDDVLAERHGGRILNRGRVHSEDTDRHMMTITALYQFMIGNTDWTVPTRHNIELIYPGPNTAPVAVPYDFDLSGLINTPYAEPSPQLNIESVVDRRFLGYCRTDEEFAAAFDLFQQKKDAIYELVRSIPQLDASYVETSIEYLDSFYEILDDPKAVKREIKGGCLKRG